MLRHFTFYIFLLFSFGSFAQSKLGDVACVSVTSKNLDSSMSLYRKLGFQETMSNTFPFPWVQASDGSLLLMIRKDDAPYMGLTYYSNELDKTIAGLEKDGVEFA